MELQDFALAHLYSQLAFAENQTWVIDQRGATAKVMTDHLQLSEVTLHPSAAEVKSPEERDSYRIGMAQIYAGLLDFQDPEEAQARTSDFLSTGLEHLGNPAVASAHIRTYEFAPASSFQALRDRLGERLATKTSELADALGLAVHDLGWTFEFEQPDVAARIQFGPMESEQLRGFLQDSSEATYPPAVLFVASDCTFGVGEQTDVDGLKWWERSLERSRVMNVKIGSWLKEVVA